MSAVFLRYAFVCNGQASRWCCCSASGSDAARPSVTRCCCTHSRSSRSRWPRRPRRGALPMPIASLFGRFSSHSVSSLVFSPLLGSAFGRLAHSVISVCHSERSKQCCWCCLAQRWPAPLWCSSCTRLRWAPFCSQCSGCNTALCIASGDLVFSARRCCRRPSEASAWDWCSASRAPPRCSRRSWRSG